MHHLLDELRVDPPDGSSFSSPLVTVMAKDFEGEATEREIWYGVKYQVRVYVCVVVPSILDATLSYAPSGIVGKRSGRGHTGKSKRRRLYF